MASRPHTTWKSHAKPWAGPRSQGAGKRAAGDIADYALTCRNHKLAVIEAKRLRRGIIPSPHRVRVLPGQRREPFNRQTEELQPGNPGRSRRHPGVNDIQPGLDPLHIPTDAVNPAG